MARYCSFADAQECASKYQSTAYGSTSQGRWIMKITFLGATEEVTGSKYFIETADTKILVDCGLFQDNKRNSTRNLEPLAVDPSIIDAVILTHAHIDHTGYIPALVK